MSLTGGIVLYVSLWFLVMFVLLPIGQQSQADAGEIVPGTHAGAPHEPQLKRKALWCTAITTVLFLGLVWFIFSGIITRDDIMNFGRFDR
ncbi:MAG: DUF1467 domain-containing protein [Paracoccus denitrificans]|nr:MAG: DUF1467 domain-containing protein [Paracoccus denitrificans]PZO83450.1 MAG: DUF1467 domain-containing protein [Paracoccus denitrificans]